MIKVFIFQSPFAKFKKFDKTSLRFMVVKVFIFYHAYEVGKV